MLSYDRMKVSMGLKKTAFGKLCGDQSGMTFMELISGLAIAAIIVASAGSLLLYTGRLFRFRAEETIYGYKANAVSAMLEKQVMYAGSIRIGRDEPAAGSYEHMLCLKMDGTVLLDGVTIFSSDEGHRLCLFVENCGKEEHRYLLEYSVRLVNGENETLYSKDNVVKLVNLDLGKGAETIHYPEEETKNLGYDSCQADIYLYYTLEN